MPSYVERYLIFAQNVFIEVIMQENKRMWYCNALLMETYLTKIGEISCIIYFYDQT